MAKKEILTYLLKENKQITRSALDCIVSSDDPLEKCKEILDKLEPDEIIINERHLGSPKKSKTTEVKILKNYISNQPLTKVSEISAYFNDRYTFFRKQLQNRLNNTISVSHLKNMENEKISLIAIVNNKSETKNGNVILELEDPTGVIRAIATKQEVIEKAKETVFDEIIGISGSVGDDIIFLNDIIWSDLPIKNEYKKLNDDVYAVFLSDTHIGSKKFMSENFDNFLDWVRGKNKLESQKEISNKIKYILIAGDIVEGIGVYPKQDAELELKDIHEQYELAAEYLKKIPKDIEIIISPGNHDYLRAAQPQPPLSDIFAELASKQNNITLVSNPATINLHGFDNGGLDILLYHGTSIDSMISADPTLNDGYEHPEKVMKSLLKRRHISPLYASGVLASGPDSLVIDTVPDIFHAGHVHSNGFMNYRGVTLINSGTWQAKTEFQRLCGHEPTPCLLPIINLKTREPTLIDFT